MSILYDNLRQRVISTTAIRGSAAVFSVALTLLIVRAYSPAVLGGFSAALVTIQLITIASTAGIDSILLRLLIRFHAKHSFGLDQALWNESVALCMVTSTAGLLLAVGLATALAALRPDLWLISRNILVMTPLIYVLNITRLCSMILRVRGRDAAAQLVDNSLPAPLALISVLVCVALEIDVSGHIADIYTIGVVATLGIAGGLVRTNLRALFVLPWELVKTRRARLLRIALPAQLANISNLISDWSSTAALTLLAPLPAVAAYRVISQVGMAYQLVATGLEVPLSSAIATAYFQRDGRRLDRLLAKARLAMFGLALPLTLALFCLPDHFLSLFHIDAPEAIAALLIAVGGYQFRLAAGAAASSLNLIDAVDKLVLVSVMTLIASIILVVILTPLFGLIGATASMVIAVQCRSWASYYFLSKATIRWRTS